MLESIFRKISVVKLLHKELYGYKTRVPMGELTAINGKIDKDVENKIHNISELNKKGLIVFNNSRGLNPVNTRIGIIIQDKLKKISSAIFRAGKAAAKLATKDNFDY